MHVRCPHCRQPVELADNAGLEHIDCPSCGSASSMSSDATTGCAHERRFDQAVTNPAEAETIGRPGESARLLSAVEARAFGDYELLEEIARGGMGVVFKARQTRLNRTVAVKMILAGELADKDDVRRFLSEAEAAAGLDHPGIVPVYESGDIDGQHFFSMGFVDGQSLAALLAQGPRPPEQAAELVAQVADAVDYAHERGVIHRDLKPGNILLDNDGHPRVTDFGLAKRVAGDSNLTRTGQALGTPSYMPPEQASGKLDSIGRPADVYALGAVLYAALIGRPPFQAATPLDTILQVLEQEPVPPRQLNADVPRDLETIVLKCLEKEPHKRYATARDMADELRRYLRGEPIQARPVGRIERSWRWCRRNPVVASLAASVLIALAAGAGVSTYFAYEASQRATSEQTAKIAAERAADRERRQAIAAKADRDRADREAAAAVAARKTAEGERTKAELAAEREKQQRLDTERALYLNRVKLAQQYWAGDNVAQSRRMLDTCPVEQRGWEWRYLDRLHHGDLLTLPLGGGTAADAATSLQLSRDGKRLAAFYMQRVLVWDISNNKFVAEIDGRGERGGRRTFRAGALSGDGETIALGEGEASGAVTLWEAGTGRFIRELARLPRAVTSLSFSPDGKALAAGGADLHLLSQLGDPLAKISEMFIAKMTRRIVSVPAGSVADRSTAEPPHNLADPPATMNVVVWNVANGEELFRSDDFGLDVCFSPDGTRLLTFRLNRTGQDASRAPDTFASLLDTVNRSERAQGRLGAAECFSFDGEGTCLALAGWDREREIGFVRLINPATGEERLSFNPGKHVGAVKLNRDGSIAVVAEARGSPAIEVWDLQTHRRLRTLRGHAGPINALALATDGRLASSSWDTTIKFWFPIDRGQSERHVASISGTAHKAAFAAAADLCAFSQSKTPSSGPQPQSILNHLPDIVAEAVGLTASPVTEPTISVVDLTANDA